MLQPIEGAYTLFVGPDGPEATGAAYVAMDRQQNCSFLQPDLRFGTFRVRIVYNGIQQEDRSKNS